MFGDIQHVKSASVVIIRTGFSTHTLVSGGTNIYGLTLISLCDRTWVSGWFNWMLLIPVTVTEVS